MFVFFCRYNITVWKNHHLNWELFFDTNESDTKKIKVSKPKSPFVWNVLHRPIISLLLALIQIGGFWFNAVESEASNFFSFSRSRLREKWASVRRVFGYCPDYINTLFSPCPLSRTNLCWTHVCIIWEFSPHITVFWGRHLPLDSWKKSSSNSVGVTYPRLYKTMPSGNVNILQIPHCFVEDSGSFKGGL